ncbi:membrane protein [Sphaerisporangium krabiense]|uniref:RND superfamily putative drug exporter n=1 Tax=Sphaerisporangium krabiense TaxID=763782 RepID=A0A7W8Z4W0_9ACTN|nr:MMPL family transporter [Sphaerisporangium krabiense]MBB5627513.1 RND superfamily putative drug exporter [Sphaerisporangium krabiense]GII66528.1 membrane protein [Sphaerisporangium krabiense]
MAFRALTRRRTWFTLLLTIVAATAVLMVEPPEPDPFQVGVAHLPDSYSSVRAERLLRELPSARVRPAIVVVSRADGAALTPADRAALDGRLPTLRRFAAGGQVAAPRFAPDGTVALVAVPLPAADQDKTTERVVALRAALAGKLPAGVRAQVTGAPAFATDLSKMFDGADTTLLLTTLLVVALLLLVTYRSPILWAVPLLVVAVTEQVALHVVRHVLPRLELTPDGATFAITSVLVFGAATDYALLLIARYREELLHEQDRFAAMSTALRQTGPAILASGGTIFVALLSLLLATAEGTRALGVACAIGVVLAVVTALFVLPAAIVLCGRGVFWPFVPRVGGVASVGRVWGRMGDAVARRPRLVAAASVVLLAGLAAGTLGLQVGLSQSEQFRDKPEAVLGAEALARAFPAGATQPVAVLTAPAAAERVVQAAEAVPNVAGAEVAERTATLARVSVVLKPEPGTDAADRAIRDLRTAVAALPDAKAEVGGEIVAGLDILDAYGRDTALILPIILVLVGLVLVVLLRGVLAPVLLVVTVGVSFLASLGASNLLFRHVLDYPALDPGVVLVAFVLMVALGVDYNIFLVTRAKEDAAHLGTRAGMLNALRVTGGVITSAGILLAAVFAVLGVIPVIIAGQIGVIVGIGVLLDTLLVRTVLVPALALILGSRFWWPGREPSAAGRARPAIPADAGER